MLLKFAALTTPIAFFWLFVEIVLVGLFVGIAIWIINTYITPNIPEPFRWVINILIGLALLALLFFLFFG